MATKPFFKGKDVRIEMLLDEKQLIVLAKSMEVEAVGEEIADDICGEERARLEFVLSHYKVMIEAMQEDLTLMKAFLAHQRLLDARTLPKESGLGFLVYPNDGTRAGFTATDYVLDAWKFSVGGRKDRNSLSIPGRCRYFDEIPTL